MTFSAPLKLMFACFAVAALVATAMSGSESAGLKGSRQLQYSQLQYSPANAVNSISANSFGIVFSLSPEPANAVNSINTNSFGIVNTLNPPPVVPMGSATAATNTIFSQAAEIFKGLNFNP
jgi:hypothetical protein